MLYFTEFDGLRKKIGKEKVELHEVLCRPALGIMAQGEVRFGRAAPIIAKLSQTAWGVDAERLVAYGAENEDIDSEDKDEYEYDDFSAGTTIPDALRETEYFFTKQEER
jgi:hypothetical protein